MTINQILAEVDELTPNTYEVPIKIGWLSKVDGRVFEEVILTHEHDLVEDEEGNLHEPTFPGYTEADVNTELLIPDTYADTYRDYLMAMIAYTNGETDRYSNSMIMFNMNFSDFVNWYNKTHLPIQKPLRLF